MSLFIGVSRMLATAGVGGARPFLTTFLVCLYVRLVLHSALPRDLAWMRHPYALGAFAALAIVEHMLWRDPDVADLLRAPMRYLTAVLAFWNARLVTALDADSVAAPVTAAGVGTASLLASLDVRSAVYAAAWVACAVVAVASMEVRVRVLRLLHDALIPRRWVRWLECGGVAGILAAVLLSPLLAVLITTVFGLGGLLLGVVSVRLLQKLDRRARRPCPGCRFEARVEATRCYMCGRALEPARWLTSGRSPVP